MGEITEVSAKKDVARKNSVMLPNNMSFTETGKSTGSSLAAAGQNVIGGAENYKRYQMLVASRDGGVVDS
jgi:hypothetical protein